MAIYQQHIACEQQPRYEFHQKFIGDFKARNKEKIFIKEKVINKSANKHQHSKAP